MDEATPPGELTMADYEVAEDGPVSFRRAARHSLGGAARALSFRNISALYILGALLLLFAIWIPDLFFTSSNLKTILYSNAVGALVAVGLVVPFAAGVFDASVGAMLGLSSVLVAYLMANSHLPWVAAVLIVMAAGGLVGLVNAMIVVLFRVESIIATLAMMSVLTGLGSAVENDQIITGFPSGFNAFGTGTFLGIGYPLWVLIVVAVLVAYVLGWTPIGRRTYATGGGEEAARLAGVGTKRIITASLVISGAVAALAGVVVTARTQSGEAAVGAPYLLPGFAAVFLGATQIRPGRYNVWGTLLAAYTLAAGVQGLILGGAPEWIPDVFDGVALAIAVALSVRRARRVASGATADRRQPLHFWRSAPGGVAPEVPIPGSDSGDSPMP